MNHNTKAIVTLQCCLIVANSPKVEVASPPKFDGGREVVGGFINACCLYAKARLGDAKEKNKISWVLSYVQGGMVEVWKDNILE